MKYLLIIWVCSFLHEKGCLEPIQSPLTYNSWYECTRDAHTQSIKLMSGMGYKYVNEYKIGIKYNCQPVQTY